ncbi:MAG: hypothetical protein WCF63_08280 [Acidimicrobiales bacterium]
MCRRRRSDDDLVRAGRTAHGTWYLGRGEGRGVWWCRDRACGGEVRVTHLARALRAGVGESEVAVVRGLATGKTPKL